MDEEDQKDIIRKVKTSGAEKDDDSLEKDVDADIDKEESEDSEEGFGEEDGLDEGSVDVENDFYVVEWMEHGDGENGSTIGMLNKHEVDSINSELIIHQEGPMSKEKATQSLSDMGLAEIPNDDFDGIYGDDEENELYVEEDTMTINLRNMKQDVEAMLSVDVDAREKKLKGHKWADDHISTSADDAEEVADFLTNEGENKKKKTGPCWSGYERVPGTKEGDKGSCRKKTSESLMEAEYQGEKVELNKPSPCKKGKKDCKKKFKVYVKNDKGNVVKVTFGDPNMEIRRDNPKAKKSFRARHKCSEKKDKTTAGYWSCKMWSNKKVSDIVGENLQESEKNSKFVESNIMKELILHRLHETVEPSIAPPVIKPGVKPALPKRKDIWKPKRHVKTKPKMVEDEVDEGFLDTFNIKSPILNAATDNDNVYTEGSDIDDCDVNDTE